MPDPALCSITCEGGCPSGYTCEPLTNRCVAEDEACVRTTYLKDSNTTPNANFGWDIALSNDRTLVVGGPRSFLAAGSVTVFTRDLEGWTQAAVLTASNSGADDNFGVAVAISGDTIAVGAFGEDSAATGIDGSETDNTAEESGAVYVFVRSGATWTQQAYIKASNTDAGDWFGLDVALSGDTLAVAARREASAGATEADDSAPGAGAVYVFTRSGAVWSQQAYLKASNADADDGFGWNLALSGDTLAVGAAGEDSAATGANGNQLDEAASGAGATYVFTRIGGTWTQEAYLKASNTDVGDNFGADVALVGETLVVGAIGEDSAATGINGNQLDNSAGNSGAVYVFTRSIGVWSQQAYLKASNSGAEDSFFGKLALSTDRLAVGAYKEDSAATGVGGNQSDNNTADSGAAYVFASDGMTWSQLGYLKAPNTDVDDAFGVSTALGPDGMIAIGAFKEDSSARGIDGNPHENFATDSGAVFVFEP